MSDDERKRRDRVAREAARLIEMGAAQSIDAALRQAAEGVLEKGDAMPGALRVRQHARHMAMQALGDAGYRERIVDMWMVAEVIMNTLEHVLPGVECELVGRAAEGLIDAGVVLHVRAYTERDERELADVLVQYEFGEPTFTTAETRYGRMSRLDVEVEEWRVAITLVRPGMRVNRSENFITGRHITRKTADELRAMIERGRP